MTDEELSHVVEMAARAAWNEAVDKCAAMVRKMDAVYWHNEPMKISANEKIASTLEMMVKVREK